MKKTIHSVLLSILFIFLLKEGTYFLYKSNIEARVHNTGFHWMAKERLSNKHQSDSFFFPFILHNLNLDLSSEDFKRLCQMIYLLASAILIFYFSMKADLYAGGFIGLFILLSPISLIQSTWIGFPDHLTYFFSICILILIDRMKLDFFSLAVTFFVLLFGCWNHFYQFSIIVSLLILTYSITTKSIHYKFISFVAATLIFARLTAIYIFYAKDIVFEDVRLDAVANTSVFHWLRVYSAVPILAFVSFFNGNIVFLLERLYHKNYFILIPILISIAVTFFTSDTTRVFTHLFYPCWFAIWLLVIGSKKSYFKENRNLYFTLILISFVILKSMNLFYVWGDRVIHLLK
ncbi:hypothetical protein [Leptospira sp. 'Mane']|uniref:hypothetical protein n=1 Tax=Leptospira sp. 'Mane' TaxID=3387407 RepID=UPI00398B4C6B